jgi:hypothetical protein
VKQPFLLIFKVSTNTAVFPPEFLSPSIKMANTEKERTIAELLALLKDKEDEVARLKLLIGTGGPPVSNAHYLSRVKSVCCFARPTSRQCTLFKSTVCFAAIFS